MKQSVNVFCREDCKRVFTVSGQTLDIIRNSSFLITGGSGFLGSWLVCMLAFLNDEHNFGINIHVISRDKDKFVNHHPILSQRPYVNFIRADIRNVVDVPRDVNYIVHAAAIPDTRVHATRPFDVVSTISEGTAALLKATNRVSNLQMFVNLSSGNVYGSHGDTGVGIAEDRFGGIAAVGGGATFYAEAKRFSESLCASARSELRIPISTLRPFSFIGPFQSADAPWAATSFVSDAINGRPIRILGDGKTVRTVMYGADFALWVLVVAAKAKSGQTFNVGSDSGHSLDELAKIVAECFSPQPDILLNSSLAGPIPNTKSVPDISHAVKELGLGIYTDTKLSIQRTIEWFKDTE